ncbi:hypothetical protein F5B21DRAFT_522009 [Xylaria acuta]|nr:hypothetical protein F5B21DRAFT_522009 [Xylaria acuta]
MVSHDRDFIHYIFQETILMIDQSLVYFAGNLTAYEDDTRSQKFNLLSMKEAQDKQVAHTWGRPFQATSMLEEARRRQQAPTSRLLPEEAGLSHGHAGQCERPQGQIVERHARCPHRPRTRFHESKRAAVEIPTEETSVRIWVPLAPDLRFPGSLVSLDYVTFSYNLRQAPVLRDIDLAVHMGARAEVSAVDGLRAAGQANPAMTALSTLAAEAGGEMDEGSCYQAVGRSIVRLVLACIVWKHTYLLVLNEVKTYFDFYTVQTFSRAFRAFSGVLVIVTHDRFLVKSAIEMSAEVLRLDDEDLAAVEEEEQGQLKRTFYLMKAGKPRLLEHGVKEFEQSLESRVDKLLAS